MFWATEVQLMSIHADLEIPSSWQQWRTGSPGVVPWASWTGFVITLCQDKVNTITFAVIQNFLTGTRAWPSSLLPLTMWRPWTFSGHITSSMATLTLLSLSGRTSSRVPTRSCSRRWLQLFSTPKLTPFLSPGVPGCQSYWRHWDGLLSGQSPWRGSSGGYLFSTLYFYPMCKPVFLSGDERSERHCLFLPSRLPLCRQRAQERMGSSSGENHLLEKFLFSQKTVQNYIFCFSGSAENVF